MIIYGWNTKNIKQAPLEAYECPSCQQQQSVMAIFAHYVHIFWIPLFPYKKSVEIVCLHCKHATHEAEIAADSKDIVKGLKSSAGAPKYLFSGLILIILGVTYLTFTSMQNANLEQSYIDDLQVGDVYIIKDSEEPSEYDHYLLKVNDIAEDSLWVSFTSYSYNGIVSSLDPKDGFYDVVYSIHRDDLKAYDESGELRKVVRDYPATSGFDRVIEYQMPDTLSVEE